MTFCCEKMEQLAQELKRKKKEKNHAVIYDQCWREYMMGFIYHERPHLACEIHYCPWCGNKLPSSLADKWFEVLEKEYGIIAPSGNDRKRIPPEFKTDEWWKKREL